ncbi:MAG: ribonuclease P protein component [Bacteroidota bacterium]|nr:ribonuclease P protein component [Bacteroidota bacterium]
MAKQFTLGKNERLRSRNLIEQLFKQGKSLDVFPYKVYYLLKEKTINIESSILNVQFGVGVSTKNFKKAVDRNRIKRVTREAYRLQKLLLHQITKEKRFQLSVFFIYTAKELSDYNQVKEKVNLILEKIIKLIDENNTPPS